VGFEAWVWRFEDHKIWGLRLYGFGVLALIWSLVNWWARSEGDWVHGIGG